MSRSIEQSAGQRTAPSRWFWMGLALLAHTSWGANPVLARYLQTVSGLPSMALVALGNLVCLLVVLPLTYRRIDTSTLRSPVLWLFALVVVLRSISNLLAARYTQAIYVQLITLMTPFIVALLSATFFRERLPPGTLWAIALSLLGSLLMVSGSVGAGISMIFSASDWLGLGLALFSAFFLAFYMLVIPRTVTGNVSGEAVYMMQLVALTITATIASLLLGEDWRRYAALGANDWLVFAAFALFVLFGANMGQISALRHLGAPMVSSMMAWRLVSTLILAALLLGEQLRTPLQAVGALIVLVTITLYLRRQATNR